MSNVTISLNSRIDLERDVEENRYRLSRALETVHEYEEEISKLRIHVAKLESESQERNDGATMELEQTREYSEQLEKQFTTQVGIIEALKRKIMQVKLNFISAAIKPAANSSKLSWLFDM